MLPGLTRYDEVAAGEIPHALRFTAPHTHGSSAFKGSRAGQDHHDST